MDPVVCPQSVNCFYDKVGKTLCSHRTFTTMDDPFRLYQSIIRYHLLYSIFIPQHPVPLTFTDSPLQLGLPYPMFRLSLYF